MITTCWSVKGGSGTTVVAAALAILATRPKRSFTHFGRSHNPESDTTTSTPRVLLIDLAGDLPSVLGLSVASTSDSVDKSALGITDWLSADDGVPTSSIERLIDPVRQNLSLLRLGNSSIITTTVLDPTRLLDAMQWCDAEFDQVIVDAGSAHEDLATPWIEGADRSILVVRPCYLSLRQAIDSLLPAHAAVVVSTDGRTLDAHDVSAVLGVRDITTIPFDSEIARLVDSGLFGKRMPRSIERLRQVAA